MYRKTSTLASIVPVLLWSEHIAHRSFMCRLLDDQTQTALLYPSSASQSYLLRPRGHTYSVPLPSVKTSKFMKINIINAYLTTSS